MDASVPRRRRLEHGEGFLSADKTYEVAKGERGYGFVGNSGAPFPILEESLVKHVTVVYVTEALQLGSNGSSTVAQCEPDKNPVGA
ncbi:hypothetical protein AB0O86_22735 [Streptomyces hirsutus]|uniref:hypothetical protein n=1 Tax=Streptomyces hirsutus TaxID=35620 RepID=UPI00343F8222